MRVQRDAGRFWSRMKMAVWSMVGTTVLWAPASYGQSPDDETTFLNKLEFRIPIEVASDKGDAIRELRLFVSTDRGVTWTQVKTVPPTQKSFMFPRSPRWRILVRSGLRRFDRLCRSA